MLKQKIVTTKEFAKMVNKPYPTVMLWLRQGRIEGASLIETPRGPVWEIPETAAKGFTPPAMGRPKKEEAPAVVAVKPTAKKKAIKKG